MDNGVYRSLSTDHEADGLHREFITTADFQLLPLLSGQF